MIVHLDTSFLVGMHRRGGPEDHRVSEWLRRADELQVSAVAWGEYLCGPLSWDDLEFSQALLSAVLPLDEPDAELAGELFNFGGRRKHSLADCFIAATAIRARAPLATSNRADFERFESAGLRLT